MRAGAKGVGVGDRIAKGVAGGGRAVTGAVDDQTAADATIDGAPNGTSGPADFGRVCNDDTQ